MNLYLLEITYAVRDQQEVEAWLAHAPLNGVVISTEQYDDEILSVLASEQALGTAHQYVRRQDAVTSSQRKRRAVFRVSTTTSPEHVLCTFPFRAGEEWYIGTGNVAYLSVQSHKLTERQRDWLASNVAISNWQEAFELVSVLPCTV